MKIVVDSNIVFSAILNSKSKIGQLLTIGSKYFDFYSVNLLKVEIHNHKPKILTISGFNKEQFDESFALVTSKIRFIDEILLSDNDLKIAMKLTSDIDENDTLFVALTNHLKATLWTGDKQLERGLKKKEYHRVISTTEVFENFLKKEFERKER